MEHPAKEIAHVVYQVAAAGTPDIQKAAIEKFFASDAEFHHPVALVVPGPNSRDAILGIYQWYRIFSSRIELEVRNVTYNESTKEAFVDVVQVLHTRFSPFTPGRSRLVVRLSLKPDETDKRLLVIACQEDFYHPDDFMALEVAALVPLVRLALRASALICDINAKIFNKLGIWRPNDPFGESKKSAAEYGRKSN
ncbi:hypothetical protein NLI96_g4005 [Meripilus lineatus]|uniref:SigF-like NTF2-like domain-containing protein n=1 Tax=Meripilus lineatus TaxID=2056292 RepID=A0AAD5VB32_9APHY|nr:hypothetical protein NLI96_g4005 [Physisporinus lineatus]